VIFTQGDAADAVYYLQVGKAKFTLVSSSGKAAVLAIIANEFSGEGCLTGPRLRMVTVTTMTGTVVVRMDKVNSLRSLRANRHSGRYSC